MSYLRQFSLAIFSAALLICSHASAGEVHAVLVIDTNDYSIGDSVEQDMFHYQQFLQNVSTFTGMKVNEHVFAADDFISANVRSEVENLAVQPDDVVVFYYSGHGYRTESKPTVWPAMHFGFEQLGLDLHDIASIIIDKQPKMALVMSDTCNGVESDIFAPSWDHQAAFQSTSTGNLQKAYRQLFLAEEIMVLTTSSEPGQYSWGVPSGGIYTNAFLKSFYHEVKQRQQSWPRLLKRAEKKVVRDEQPLYEIIPLRQL